jgi:hypothetical protein
VADTPGDDSGPDHAHAVVTKKPFANPLVKG